MSPFKIVVIVTAAVCASLQAASPLGAAELSPFTVAPLSDEELSKTAGRKAFQFGIAAQETVVANNKINGDSVTGQIHFDGQAFQNMSGLVAINANTGNNVSFNSSMLVNINVGVQP